MERDWRTPRVMKLIMDNLGKINYRNGRVGKPVVGLGLISKLNNK
jgi:hypothetical protein